MLATTLIAVQAAVRQSTVGYLVASVVSVTRHACPEYVLLSVQLCTLIEPKSPFSNSRVNCHYREDMETNNLYAIVSPGIGVEELADANWYMWLVLAHADPDMLTDDKVQTLVDEYKTTNPSPDSDTDWEAYDDWKEKLDTDFRLFAQSKGYVVFNQRKGLVWLND